jgi:hypothetical protein
MCLCVLVFVHVRGCVSLVGPQVFLKHPELFGLDSPHQRVRWAAEVEWATNIVATRQGSPRTLSASQLLLLIDGCLACGLRCYGERGGDAPGAQLIPMLDLLNHQNAGSLSTAVVSEPGMVVMYTKIATMAYKQVSYGGHGAARSSVPCPIIVMRPI